MYLTDSGLLHTLLDIESLASLERHPTVGASWEGFLLEAVIQRLGLRSEQCYFWATHGGAELDLLVVDGRFPGNTYGSPPVSVRTRGAVAH